ncbi:MAG: SIMPL domain-containing protein [Fibrobacter sp.]|nr:SIMPL domain-containing protein [Fibrobacter sp.]
MGNKISAFVICALSVVCIALVFQKGDGKKGNAFIVDSGDDETASIDVSASEEKNFVANEYRLGLVVELHGKNKDELYKELEMRRNQIFASAKSLGISAENVEQNSLEIDKQWNYIKNKQFVAKQMFNVSVSNKDVMDSLNDLLSSISDVEIVSSNSRLKNGDSLQAEIVKKVCRKALFKADRYAESVGEKAGKFLRASGNVNVSEYNFADSVSIGATVDLSLAFANSDEDGKAYLSVQAEESQKFIADEFLSQFTIEIEDTDKKSLYKKVDQRSAEVITQILSMGVPNGNISAQPISLAKEWNYSGEDVKLVGYKASQRILIKSESKALATALVDRLALYADVQCDGTNPLLKNLELREAQVIQKAGEKAMAKANLFAGALDMKVGKTVKLSETSFNGRIVLGSVGARKNAGKYVLASTALPQNVVADSVEVSATMSLTVELE